MLKKVFAIALVTTALVVYGAYKLNPSVKVTVGAMPENVSPCEDKDYTLSMISFKTDGDIVPGEPNGFNANFNTNADGTLKEMDIEVYKSGYKLYTMKNKEDKTFQRGTEFDYRYQLTLPGFIPHIAVQLKMRMYDGDKKELGCIKFDLNL